MAEGEPDPTRRRRIARKLVRHFYKEPAYPADGIVPVRDLCAACGGTGERLLPTLEAAILDYLARHGPTERRDLCRAYQGIKPAAAVLRAIHSLFGKGLVSEAKVKGNVRLVDISSAALDLRAAAKTGVGVDKALAQGMIARVTPLRAFTLDVTDRYRLSVILNAIRHGYLLGPEDQRLLALAIDNYKRLMDRITEGM